MIGIPTPPALIFGRAVVVRWTYTTSSQSDLFPKQTTDCEVFFNFDVVCLSSCGQRYVNHILPWWSDLYLVSVGKAFLF